MKRFLAFTTSLFLLIIALPATQTHADEDWLPEGYVLVDDMVLPEEYVTGRATIEVNLWPSTIAYTFDSNVNSTNQSRAIAAMAEIEAVANIDFVPRTDQVNYIKFLDANGNSSPVGMQGGEQTIRMFNWSYRFIIVHELMHSLGFFHEQSRTDRNTYVTIQTANIEEGKEHNFDLEVGTEAFPRGAYGLAGDRTYDFDSVMHYGATAFSKNDNPTIVVNSPWNETWQDAIGQRDHMSDLDELSLSLLYKENNWRIVDRTQSGSENGELFSPYDTVGEGVDNTPNNGTVMIMPGTYSGVRVYNDPMTLTAPLGSVTIGD